METIDNEVNGRFTSLDLLQNLIGVEDLMEPENGDNKSQIAKMKKACLMLIDMELTETQRRYFIMYYVNSLSMPEIAEILGVNKSSVSRSISAGLKKLRKRAKYITEVL